MKIGQPSDLPVSPSQTGAGAAASAKANQQSQGAASTATRNATSATSTASVAVTVSAQVRSMAQAERTGASAVIDMDKVNAVRDAIENGSYVVDPEAIADKLLSNAKEMLDRSRS
jgi:negative regulator of flagellin synthesis FlgM